MPEVEETALSSHALRVLSRTTGQSAPIQVVRKLDQT